MKLQEMHAAIAQDLEHIAKGAKGSPQNMLRMHYEVVRETHLRGDPSSSRAKSFQEALKQARQSSPAFEPEYDREYFDA